MQSTRAHHLRFDALWTPARPLFARLKTGSRTKLQASQKAPRARLVVIGNGMVGQRFCERLIELEAGARYEIVVLSEEAIPAYDRVHLSDIWRGRAAGELVLRDRAWYSANGVELCLDERAETIDVEAQRVTTHTGREVRYDKLVLATGSRATVPKLSGEGVAALMAYRTIGDAQRILREIGRSRSRDRRVVIIGGGLLGLEAARAMQQLGCEVVVIETASQLMPRQLDPPAAAELARALRGSGIDLRLKASIARVATTESGVRLELDDGEAVTAGMAVVAAGARACDELARAAGLRCHQRGGVEVDERLQTSRANVFAIGECASHVGVPHGLVAPGYAMANVLADNLVGKKRRLPPQEAVTRLKLDLIEVTVLGNPLESADQHDWVWQKEGHYRRLLVGLDRRINAALCVGPWDELPLLQRLVSEGRRVRLRDLQAFRRTGKLGAEGAQPAILVLPAETVICQCANVTCGTLRRAIAAGHSDPDALARTTSASTLCGSCKPLLVQMCGMGQVVAPQPPSRVLPIAGATGAILALAIAVAPRIPIADSVLSEGIDVLWVDPLWKQVSGFTLVALIALGLGLSLRKRSAKFRWGNVNAWRVVHGVFGVLGLVALIAHTGFRLGDNLNRVLALAFLASAFTGAASGMLARVSLTRPGSRLSQIAPHVRSLHDYTFWPLPVLVGLHVFKTYFY
ncbi:MAG TPA: FAD-dependent oxidoreductase [Polyangiaceae bacterium]